MGLETRHTGIGRTFSGQRQLLAFPFLFRTLIWLWLISFVLAIKPNSGHGVSQKTPRKETPKGKTTPPTPPIKRLTKATAETPPIENMERREYIVQRTKAGDTLYELLDRFGLSTNEKQLWSRSIQRNI